MKRKINPSTKRALAKAEKRHQQTIAYEIGIAYRRGVDDGRKIGNDDTKKRREAVTKVLEAYAKIIESSSIAITNIAQELQR